MNISVHPLRDNLRGCHQVLEMKPFEVVDYKGKRIAVLDISNSKPAEAVAAYKGAQQKIMAMPKNSVLILTDASNAVYNKDSADATKEFVAKNTPFVKASAVVGADGMREMVKNTASVQSHRKIESFKTQKEAMDWLVAQ